MTKKTLLPIAPLVLVTAVLGCAIEPTHVPFDLRETGQDERASVRQVATSPQGNALVLGPGESVQLHGLSEEDRYQCSNGRLLVCDRIGLTAYCSCPRVWQRR